MIKIIKKHSGDVKVVILFALISLSIILVWFNKGLLYGGGDVGLPTYDPMRIIEITKYTWWPDIAPGFLMPFSLTAVPFELLLAFFQIIGFNSVMLQALTFFVALLLMSSGMYFLFRNYLREEGRGYAIIAAFFYLLNTYMMVQVWHRFVHTAIIFVAVLPFLVLTFRGWVFKGQQSKLIIFLIINFLSSYVFGTLAFVLTLWLTLSLILIFEVIFPLKTKQQIFEITKRFAITFIFWILVNCWWLISVLNTGPALFSSQFDSEANLVSFIAISKLSILPFTFSLINPFYLYQQAELGTIYASPLFKVLIWVPIIVVFVGFIASLRNKKYIMFAVAGFIVLFLAKGVSEPFGYLYFLAFTKSFIIGVIRNPFEKIGILLPFFYSFLFAIGLKILNEKVKIILPKTADAILPTLLILTLVTLSWPLWTGRVFGSIDNPAYVEVPDYYKKADIWITQNGSSVGMEKQGKILHLPLSLHESATYAWNYGYHGTDSIHLFFKSYPSISRILNQPKLDNSLVRLSLLFSNPNNYDSEVILKYLQNFNVKYIVLHKDMKWLNMNLYDSKGAEKILNNLAFLRRETEIGELVIYKIPDDKFSSEFEIVNVFDGINLQENDANKALKALTLTSDVISDPYSENVPIDLINNYIISPFISYDYYQIPKAEVEAYLNSSSDPAINPLIKYLMDVRENQKYNIGISGYEFLDRTLVGTFDIINIYRSYLPNGNKTEDLESYYAYIRYFDTLNIDNAKLISYFTKPLLDSVMQIHLYALEKLSSINQEEGANFKKSLDTLKTKLNERNLLPQNIATESAQISNKYYFKFSIPIDGEYSLALRDDYLKNNQGKLDDLDLRLDDERVAITREQKDRYLEISKIKLDKGIHEISINKIISDNQISDQSIKDRMITLDNFKIFESELGEVEGGASYNISFDAITNGSEGFYVQIVQDTDPLDERGNKIAGLSQLINAKVDVADKYNFPMPPLRLTTKKAVLRIGVPASNNPLSLEIKNLEVRKIFDREPYLIKQIGKKSVKRSAVNFKKLSTVSYTGSFQIEEPSVLIFKQTFHPGWKLYLRKQNMENPVESTQFVANYYANSWYINQPGQYKFELKFEPQNMFILGGIISGGSFVALVGWVFVRRQRND